MRFLTVFPNCENIHLVKDVGMIPYLLHKEEGYDSTIASYNNGEYPYLANEVKGLNHVFISKKFKSMRLNVLYFILTNYRKYDILQVYHFSIDSLLFLSFFKMLKAGDKRTRTYLKLDADDDILKIRMRGVLGFFGKKMIDSISLISVETKMLFDKLQEKKIFEKSLVYIPNGFYDYGKKNIVDFIEKKNTFLTVGRIGTYQKNNEVLLEAFKLFAKDNSTWNLQLVGPIESNFNDYIKQYFTDNPELRNRVLFVGAISDRPELNKFYQEAKVFVLSSRYESFGLVYLEAMAYGCTIISSNVTPAYDLVDNGRLGAIFNMDYAYELKESMINYANEDSFLKDNSNKINEFAYDNYYWPILIKRINQNLLK